MQRQDQRNLHRFVTAQEHDFPAILRELAAGEKRGHWMWYVFPQAAGLGHSAMSQTYALSSEAEAQAYANHAVLGPRLMECTTLVINVAERSIKQVFPHPDYIKFRSSMTLFLLCAAENALFERALDKYFGGQPDDRTIRIVENWRRGSTGQT